MFRKPVLQTAHLWLPGYCRARFHGRGLPPVKRVWVAFADHFEPWWRRPDDATALERVRRWTRGWPEVAGRHLDSAGRPACYTFFYPEEQYDARVMDELAKLRDRQLGDVEVHIHHDADTAPRFVERMSLFLERLATRHGLLHRTAGRVRFGFIHGNWALDNALPDGRHCGLNNEITLLRDLGCYADFTMPSVPSPAQTRMVNTIYWAKDDPAKPKSHDTGVEVTIGGGVEGDLMMIPGPLGINFGEWGTAGVPKVEVGELAGNALPTPGRVRLWIRLAPRLGGDVFIKLFGHGAPEKNAVPLLEEGALDRALSELTNQCAALGAELFFVSTWELWNVVEAIRRRMDPIAALGACSSPAAAPMAANAS